MRRCRQGRRAMPASRAYPRNRANHFTGKILGIRGSAPISLGTRRRKDSRMITRTASARYEGFGKEGKGHVSTQSGVLADQPYGFSTRFEDAPGTNPEELIAAAHAACFSMALSFALAR